MTALHRHAFDTSDVDAELAGLEVELDAGYERIATLLALAFAVQRDAGLRTLLDARALAPRFALALDVDGPYLVIERGKLAGSAMPRSAPAGLDVVELRAALAAEPHAVPAFQRALRAGRADADHAIGELRHAAERFSREAFARLARWAPLVAADAYRQTALLQSIFDLGRAELLASPRPGDLLAYWTRVHQLGHLTLLAAAAEPHDWLADLASSFSWRVWTPSFPLVRERISRLAVRGAWAAARFGASTLDRYAGNLDAPQLLRVFDAAIALVAIGSASASDADRAAIARELAERLGHRERTARLASEQWTIAAIARSARLALADPDEATRVVAGGGAAAGDRAEAVARAVDTDGDAADVDAAGWYRAILAMAALARAPAELFVPRAADLAAPRWRPQRALDALSRTLAARSRELN